MSIKQSISKSTQALAVIAFALSVTACGSDDAAPSSGADPNNCKTPCIQIAPVMDKTTIQADTGDTIVMTIAIVGDASLIDVSGSFITLEPFANTSPGQGRLAIATGGVVDTVANTLTVNFVIPVGTVTGDFYPRLTIDIPFTPDPNDPGSGIANNVLYELDSTNSTTNYSFSEIVDGEGSTFTSNGIFVGTIATPIVIPTVTLQ